ncbi:MAG: ion transporter [Rhodobacteraceae bacterium]|nr:ion transporter [Paracoccaceae bacterium]
MNRTDIIDIIDGTHPTAPRWPAYAHQGLIMLSAVAIAVETEPGLPPLVRHALFAFEIFVLGIFAAEYLLRLWLAKNRWRYATSFWGIVDLVSALPLFFVLSSSWAALRTLRLLRLVRMLKLLHTNRAMLRLQKALEQTRGELAVFAFLAAIIVYIAGVGIYTFEHEAQPEVFSSIPDSLWWAVVSFTTVGYGDSYPITWEGRIFTAAILFVGLGVIAVPTAIITTALINADLREDLEDEIEGDIRRELKKDLGPLTRKPKRRK